MKIPYLSLENIRCFKEKQTLELSLGINLFVGTNNSGKSTILKSIYSLQSESFLASDITYDSEGGCFIQIGVDDGNDTIRINEMNYSKEMTPYIWIEIIQLTTMVWRRNNSFGVKDSPAIASFDRFPNVEPNNVIYPYFTNRKVEYYNTLTSIDEANKITGTLSNLTAKVDRLMNPMKSNYEVFKNACLEILGFQVSSEYSQEGKYIAFLVDDNRSIPLTSMGTGVANILGLIVDICTAKNKIFLIEEPENDIHPSALRALLKLIEKNSNTNQFFISTHSNIVVRYLGANEKAKVFQISSKNYSNNLSKVPNSSISEISNNTVDRMRLLEDLGYEMFDYSLWKGWLFLEESSAEVIIREFLIPNFTPNLKDRLRTYSARSISGIKNKFEDFNNLFVYVHLDTSYKNRAWVLIDGGIDEEEIINDLKEKYKDSGWLESQFRQLSKHDFEEYYPDRFSNDIKEIKSIGESNNTNKQKKNLKQEAKKNLLEKVKLWYKSFPDEAKVEFERSAKDVIDILKEIETVLT